MNLIRRQKEDNLLLGMQIQNKKTAVFYKTLKLKSNANEETQILPELQDFKCRENLLYKDVDGELKWVLSVDEQAE